MRAIQAIDAQRGATAHGLAASTAPGLAASTSGPPGAVVAGESFAVLLELELAAGAPGALIVTVEPSRPLRLIGAGRSRAIVRPGEARRIWVTVALPPDTEPGEHRVRLAIRAPGGVVLRRSCVVEVNGAPVARALVADLIDLREPPLVDVIDLRTSEPARRAVAPTVGPRRHEADPAAPDEFAAPGASAGGATRGRPRHRAVDRLRYGVGVLLMVVAVVGAVLSATAESAGDPDAPAPVADRFLVVGSIVLDAEADPSQARVVATVTIGGAPHEVVAALEATGRFALRLPTGTHQLVVSAPGFVAATPTVVVHGADVDLGPITLSRT